MFLLRHLRGVEKPVLLAIDPFAKRVASPFRTLTSRVSTELAKGSFQILLCGFRLNLAHIL
jgi:hypothetical protein